MKVMNPRLVRWSRKLELMWRALAMVPRATPAASDALVRSILVTDFHLVGDMVMLVPLLQGLRNLHPEARIVLVAGPWAHAILKGAVRIDQLIEYSAPWVKAQPPLQAFARFASLARRLHREGPWDLGLDVRGDVRQILLLWLAGCARRVGFDFTGGAPLLTKVAADDGAMHHILDHHRRLLEAVDPQGPPKGPLVPRLALDAEELSAARSIEPYVGFHFGASLPLRQLPHGEAVALLQQVADRQPPLPLVIFETPDMSAYLDRVLSTVPAAVAERAQRWKGSLRDFVVMLSRAERLYAMDSGPAHIAAALGCETVVFFGPNKPAYTVPVGSRVLVVENPFVPCRPCDQRHCVHVEYQACLKGLVPAAVHLPRHANSTSSP